MTRTFSLYGRPLADVEEVRLVDRGHRLLQRGEIVERLGADELVVAAVVQEVLARQRVEGGDDFDARAGDPLIEPVRPVAEDLDDVGERRRHAALQSLDGLARDRRRAPS